MNLSSSDNMNYYGFQQRLKARRREFCGTTSKWSLIRDSVQSLLRGYSAPLFKWWARPIAVGSYVDYVLVAWRGTSLCRSIAHFGVGNQLPVWPCDVWVSVTYVFTMGK